MPFDLDPLSELTSGKSSLDSLIVKHSQRTGLDPDLVRRLVHQESRGKSNTVSPKGAGGDMQLMPATARTLGVKNVFDPDENIRGGTDYLKQQLDRFGDVNLALAAYNAGPGAVIKHGNKVPPYAETQNYVKTIGAGYQGTGYAQDPLTELTTRKTITQTQPQSDPLTELTQSSPIAPQPQGRGASMAQARAQPRPRVRSPRLYDTPLSPQDEQQFQQWKQQYAPNDSGADYDLRGAFKAGLTPDPKTGHWPDTFKKPNHPTFSVESQYAVGTDRAKAGHWEGDRFVPAQVVRISPDKSRQRPITPDMVSKMARGGMQGSEPSMAGTGASQGALSDADKLKEAVRFGAPPGFSLLPEDAQNVIGEQIGKGAAGIASLGAGLARNLPHDPLDQQPITAQVANKLNETSQILSRGGQQMEQQANRPTVNVPVLGKVGTQDIYNLGGGAISSAPALILTGLGVPAPVAFGLDSYLKASGRDADWQDILKETGLGAATGALFEIPLPTRMALLSRIGAKLGLVGGGTYGLEKIAGMPEAEARKNAAVNALFAATGAGSREIKPELQPVEIRPERVANPTVRPSDLAKRATTPEEQVTSPRPITAEPRTAFERAGRIIEERKGQFVDGIGEVTPSPNQRGVKAGFVRVLRHADGGQQIVPANAIVEQGAFKMNVPAESASAETIKPEPQVQIPAVEFVPNLGEVERGNQQGVKRGFVRVIANGQQHIVPESQIQQGRRVRVAQLGDKPFSVVRNFNDQEFFLPQDAQHPANFQARRQRNTENGNKGQFTTGAKTYDSATPTPTSEPSESAGRMESPTPDIGAATPELTESIKPQPLITKPRESEPSTTSARESQVAVSRAELDLPDLPQAERKSWQTSLSNAKPEKAGLLADEVLNKPRALNDEETASLVVRAQEIKNEHSQIMKEIGDSSDPETIQAKRAHAEALEREFDKLTRATKASGTEKGRTLAAQKLTINQDYDLVSLVQRAKAAKGRELNADERGRYEKMATQIEDLNKQLSEATEKAKTAQLQRSIDKVKRQTARQQTKSVLDDEFASLKAQLASAKLETRSGVQGSLLAGLDPEGKLTPIIARMAKNRVKAGINSAEALVTEVFNAVKDHYDVSREDIARLVRGTLHQPDDVLSKWDKRRQSQLLKQQTEIETKLGTRDFTPKAAREAPIYNRETARLQRQVDEIKTRYNRELYRATRSVGGRITDELAKAANVPKTIKSMGDISAVFRQGGYYAITHPINGLALPFRDMVQSFSDAGWRNVENKIKNDPDFEVLKRAGVEFTGVDKNDPNLSKHEEGYLGSEHLDYIPVAKQVKDFSERTFVSFLDAQRLYVGKKLLRGLTDPGIIARTLGAKQGLTRAELARDMQRIARAINSATGRGDLGKAGNQAAPLLNVAMFSPRLLKSRVELLNSMFNPVAWTRMPRNARAQILQDNVKFMAATVAVLSIAKAAGGTVSLDPDDGDFLKIRFGNTTYDTLTGLQQPMRYLINMSRAITGGETYAGKSKSELTKQFARSKLSPLAGTAVDYVAGEDMTGRPFSAKRAAIDTITPLPAKDVIEAFQQDGLLGAIKSTPTFTGIGVNTYPVSPEKATTQAEKLARKFIRAQMPDSIRTEEQISQSNKLRDLRARSRKGEDVSAELERSGATDRQSQSILDAQSKTRLKEDVTRLSPKDALLVYETATPTQRNDIRPTIEGKVTTKKLYELDPLLQSDIRSRMKRLGLHERTPDEIVPQEIKRVQRVKKIPDYSIRPTAQ